jgi:threonine-phosphate decarboxylase
LLSWVSQISRKELMSLRSHPHGGDVWSVADDSTIKRGRLMDFSSNISPLGPSRKVLNAIKNNLWKVSLYPQPDADNLRRIIAQQYEGLSTENVIVGNGSSELIDLFAKGFIQKRTSAIIPIPTYSEYESAVQKSGGRIRNITPKDDLNVDLQTVLKLVDKDNPVFICNPNNPTGALTNRGDLVRIIESAAGRRALVFVDEAFMDFTQHQEDYTLAAEVKKHDNLFVLRSLTKFHGLPGLRIGYGLGSAEIIDVLRKVKIPWNVNCLAQAAAEVALKDLRYATEVRELVMRERTYMTNRLKTTPGLRIHDSKVNFLLIDTKATGLTARQISEYSLNKGIMIRDCSSFKGMDEYHIRVAIKTRRQNTILLDFLEGLCWTGKL